MKIGIFKYFSTDKLLVKLKDLELKIKGAY